MRDSVELLISTRFPATTMNRLSGIELCKKIRIENQICIIHAMSIAAIIEPGFFVVMEPEESVQKTVSDTSFKTTYYENRVII